MSEKLAEVFEQYDIEILSAKKGRGATILTTTEGMRILEPFRGSVTRLEQEYVLKELFFKAGSDNLDRIIPNKDGQLLTCDKYRQPYVLKYYFTGNECDMHNLDDVLHAVEALAHFHVVGQGIAEQFSVEWDLCRQKKELKRIEEIRKAIANGEELERITYIYEISEKALETALKQGEENTCEDEPGCGDLPVHVNVSTNEETDSNMQYIRIKDTFERHNREIKKIQKYISGVKRKNEFEKRFQNIVNCYVQKGMECVGMLEQMVTAKDDISLYSVWKHHYGICHGSYNHHNVILDGQDAAIVHFERFSKGNQLEDLYQFARKAMEKNEFDFVLLEDIFRAYNRVIRLSDEDYYYLYILFAYPEKFWKIANSYYNSNKAFLSPKYMEKLNTVILQEQEKQDMLEKYWGFHSL